MLIDYRRVGSRTKMYSYIGAVIIWSAVTSPKIPIKNVIFRRLAASVTGENSSAGIWHRELFYLADQKQDRFCVWLVDC